MSGHGALLRLFDSELFDSSHAVVYLHRYRGNIGIQHYVCERLRQFPTQDIEFLLPQLVHLLVSTNSESQALEELLFTKCRELGHVALLIYWYIQAAAEDARRNGPPAKFHRCRNLFHKCRSILFEDSPPLKSNGLYDMSVLTRALSRRRIRENTRPALVGIGAVLAATVCPPVVEVSRDLILSQGRRFKQLPLDDDPTNDDNPQHQNHPTQTPLHGIANHRAKSMTTDPLHSTPHGPRTITVASDTVLPIQDHPTTNDALKRSQSTVESLARSGDSQRNGRNSADTVGYYRNKGIRLLARMPHAGPTTDELHRGDAFSFDTYARNVLGIVAPESVRQFNSSNTSSTTSETDALRLVSSIKTSTLINDPRYESEVKALRSSFYFNAELRFMLALVDISDRLRSVPKMQRQSSLMAELELINHNLPADICLPSWCHATSPCDLNTSNSSNQQQQQQNAVVSSEDLESPLSPTTEAADDGESIAETDEDNGSNVHSSRRVSTQSDTSGHRSQSVSSVMSKLKAKVNEAGTRRKRSQVANPMKEPFMGHHRVVRISTGDCVVLNSADRVPYLVSIEVLEDESLSGKIDMYEGAVIGSAWKINPLGAISGALRTMKGRKRKDRAANDKSQNPTTVVDQVSEVHDEDDKVLELEESVVISSKSLPSDYTQSAPMHHLEMVEETESPVRSIDAATSGTVTSTVEGINTRDFDDTVEPKDVSEDTPSSNPTSPSVINRKIQQLTDSSEDMGHYELVKKRRQSATSVSTMKSRATDPQSASGLSVGVSEGKSFLGQEDKIVEVDEPELEDARSSEEKVQTASSERESITSPISDSKVVPEEVSEDVQSDEPTDANEEIKIADSSNMSSVRSSANNLQVKTDIKEVGTERRESADGGEITPGTAEITPGSGSLIDGSLIAAEEATERMRTAAIMLAQLYKQQQRELSKSLSSSSTALTKANSGLGSLLQGGRITVGAGGLPSMLFKDTTSKQGGQGTGGSSDTTSKRNYYTLANDFEQVRAGLLKEMVALEDRRVKALQNYRIAEEKLRRARERRLQKKFEKARRQKLIEREKSQPASAPAEIDNGLPIAAATQDVDAGLDELLSETEEATLKNAVIKKDKEDPSAAVFRETWADKVARIRAESPYGKYPNWRLISCIVKSGADLRQEQLALQLIKEFQNIWREEGVPVWCCYFHIMILSDQSGLVETIKDAPSIHQIKKEGYSKNLNQKGYVFTLYDYFINQYGGPNSPRFKKAQDNFMRSLAAYSVICYLLQIKDRHNGNILLDIHGHVIHIDFGFMLSNSPGSIGVELAPFKLPQDYIDIFGGLNSELFDEFRQLVFDAFDAIRKKADRILGLVQIMEYGSTLDCFTGQSSKPQNFQNVNLQMKESVEDSSAFLDFMGIEYDMPGKFSRRDGGAPSNDTRYGNQASGTQSNHAYGDSSDLGISDNGDGDDLIAVDYASYTSSTKVDTATPRNTQYPVTAALKSRCCIGMSEIQLREFVNSLIDRSCNSAYTRMYDNIQYYANGIL